MEMIRLSTISFPARLLLLIDTVSGVPRILFGSLESEAEKSSFLMSSFDLLLLWHQDCVAAGTLKNLGFEMSFEGWKTPEGDTYTFKEIKNFLA
jgi:hypothetical protein